MKNKEQIKILTEFRNSLGLSQTAIAKLLGIDSQLWSSYENGRREPTLALWLRMKDSAINNSIQLNESLFYSELKKEHDEISFATHSLIELRTHLGLSQGNIASNCGITYRTWGRYERGETELLASTYFKIRDYARQHGVDLQTPIIAEEKKEKVIKVRSPQDNSMRLQLTQVA